MLASVRATKSGFALALRRAREVTCWRGPSKRSTGWGDALLADGESWSSSGLAPALGSSPRTVQLALESLECSRSAGGGLVVG